MIDTHPDSELILRIADALHIRFDRWFERTARAVLNPGPGSHAYLRDLLDPVPERPED